MYWCHSDGGGKYSVKYGIIEEQYNPTEVFVQFLAPRESRLVNGISINKFESDGKYKKLPNGWTYNTDLYELTWEPLTEEEKNFKLDIKDPATIKEAFNRGFIVKDEEIYHGTIVTDVTKDGYKVVKRYPSWMHHICNASIESWYLYYAYEEAQKIVNCNLQELYRQAALSDYEWSVEQIDKTLRWWQYITNQSDLEVHEYRDWLLRRDNIEDIETRTFGGQVQWKYWKNQRWNNIELTS